MNNLKDGGIPSQYHDHHDSKSYPDNSGVYRYFLICCIDYPVHVILAIHDVSWCIGALVIVRFTLKKQEYIELT